VAHIKTALPQPALFQTAKPEHTAIAYSSFDMQALLGAMYATPGRIRPGPDGGLQIVQNPGAADWTVTITPGKAIVDGADPGELKYMVRLASDAAPLRLDLAAAGIPTNPPAARHHLVYLAVYEESIQGAAGTGYGGAVVLREDTGAGATPPADSPIGYLLLGHVFISPGQANITTANIQNENVRAIGYLRVAAGTRTVTVASGASNGFATVSLPAGRFTETPTISATQSSLPGGTGQLIPKVTQKSTTSFRLYLYTGNGLPLGSAESANVDWIAVQNY
jgi:hypothetical protein